VFETRKKPEDGIPKRAAARTAVWPSDFRLGHSFVIRVSSFVMRSGSPKISKNTLASARMAAYSSRSFSRKLFMRRPRGIKTRKSVAKRFKITAGGKVLRLSAGRRHLAQTKSPKRRRSLRGLTTVDATDVCRITPNLPFSH
jgi:large subunit ribosomal protein L35